MTTSLRLQAAALAAVLCIALFFCLRQVIVPVAYVPGPSFEEAPGIELTRMSPSNLEIYLQGLLEQLRNGKGLSHSREEALIDIRQDLIDKMIDQPTLLARILAIIDEILLLNDDLIYPDDGEPRTDEDH